MKDIKKLLKKEIHQVFDGSAEEKEELKQKIGMTNKREKKNRYPLIISISSAFACALLLIILLPLLLVKPSDSYIPTYMGMTVQKMQEETSLMSSRYSISDPVIFDELFEFDESNEYQYYAKKGEVVILNVHIKNPKAYEILSITINDVKFQSLSFDPEHPSEKVLIPYKCSDVSGVETITISEIKYIDGTEIKNGKFEADRSIEIGVEYTDLPKLKSINLNVGLTTVDFEISIDDVSNLIKTKMLRLVILKDNKIIDNKVLVPGDNKIAISNLSMSNEYSCYILAAYDSLGGNGYKTVTLYDERFTTKTGVVVENEQMTTSSYSFTLDYNEDITIKEIVLMNGSSEMIKIDVNDSKCYEINDLLSQTDYILIVTYSYQGKEDTIEHAITTNSVEFDFIDEDNISAIIILNMVEIVIDTSLNHVTNIAFRLYDGDTLISEECNYEYVDGSISTIITADITANKTYKLEILVDYDLNDGLGVKTYSVFKDIYKSE